MVNHFLKHGYDINKKMTDDKHLRVSQSFVNKNQFSEAIKSKYNLFSPLQLQPHQHILWLNSWLSTVRSIICLQFENFFIKILYINTCN